MIESLNQSHLRISNNIHIIQVKSIKSPILMLSTDRLKKKKNNTHAIKLTKYWNKCVHNNKLDTVIIYHKQNPFSKKKK